MMAAIFNLAILDSAILVFLLKLTLTCRDWLPPFAQKNFTHSFWLNLMMAATLNSAMLNSDTAILDSDTLLSSLRFTQKHSHSTLTLNQINSIWLNLIPSHLTWWRQPSWILPSWIQPFYTKLWLKLIQSDSNSFILTQLDDGSHLQFWPILDSAILQRINFTHSFWLNLMMAAIFNSAMLDSATTILNLDTLLSSLRFAQKHSHSTLTLNQTNSNWLKLIHSDSNLMMAAILNSANLNSIMLDSAILVFSLKLTHTCHNQIPTICTKLTSLHSFWLKLMMAAILNSAILNSPILHKTLTQTNSIWLKLIPSHINLVMAAILEFCHLEFSHFAQNSDSN